MTEFDYVINSTRPGTIACQYRVRAKDRDEAMRQVYDAKVQPALVAIEFTGIPGTGDSIKEILVVGDERAQSGAG